MGELAHSEGTIAALLRHLKERHDHVSISDGTAARYFKDMKFSYKRYRYSLNKHNQQAFEHAGEIIDALGGLDHEQRCELLYFDESGFNPNPSLQYGWSRIGETRSVEPLAHRQRINVLGALRHDGQLIWTTPQRPTRHEDVIAFSTRSPTSRIRCHALCCSTTRRFAKARRWRKSGDAGNVRSAPLLLAAL